VHLSISYNSHINRAYFPKRLIIVMEMQRAYCKPESETANVT